MNAGKIDVLCEQDLSRRGQYDETWWGGMELSSICSLTDE